MRKTKAPIFVEVPALELAEFRTLLEKRGNKSAFLDALPHTRVGKGRKMQPMYTRRQLDYGLERGTMPRGLYSHLKDFYKLYGPEPSPAPA